MYLFTVFLLISHLYFGCHRADRCLQPRLLMASFMHVLAGNVGELSRDAFKGIFSEESILVY